MMGRHLSVIVSIVGQIRRGIVMFSVNWLILNITGGSIPFMGGEGRLTHSALIDSRIGSCSSRTTQ